VEPLYHEYFSPITHQIFPVRQSLVRPGTQLNAKIEFNAMDCHKHETFIATAHHRWQIKILGITWKDKLRNEEVGRKR